MVELPSWVPGRMLYQLHSLGAAGAPRQNPDVDAAEPCGRGLRVLRGWVDHMADLGCGAVLLTPIFVSSTHGYDTADALRIDQRLGDEADFTDFADACHERGLKVVLDAVCNHVGRAFGPFREVLQQGVSAPHAHWFRLDPSGDDGDGFGYATFEGHRELVALDHRNEAVLEWCVAVCEHWLDQGADGWRFDAAYAIPPAFLARLAARITASHPDALLFGEVIHGDYAGFVERSGLHSVTQYELHKAIWSSLNDANLFELAWALERHRSFAAAFAPVTFAGNHDVTRLASQLHEPAHIALAAAVVCTVPGIPCTYYGDELAWRGVKEHRAGGDDAIRPVLPGSSSPVSAEQRAALAAHRELIAFRRDRPWLTTGELEVVERANQRLSYTVAGDGGAIRVDLDTAGQTPVQVPGWPVVVSRPGLAISEQR